MRPDLGAYVLGGLTDEEAADVRRHLALCPECRAEHEALAPLPSLLETAGGAEAATAEPLPPAFEERLLDAFARDRAAAPRRRRRRWLPRLRTARARWMTAGAGVAAAAAVVLAVVLLTGDDGQQPRYDVVLQSTTAAPNASARAQLESESEGTELRMWVRGLPAEPGVVYEVVCEAPGWEATAGTFRVDERGRAYVRLTTAARRGQYDAIRVVRHTPDASRDVDVLTAALSS
jgi:anti-sigma factor RsiW